MWMRESIQHDIGPRAMTSPHPQLQRAIRMLDTCAANSCSCRPTSKTSPWWPHCLNALATNVLNVSSLMRVSRSRSRSRLGCCVWIRVKSFVQVRLEAVATPSAERSPRSVSGTSTEASHNAAELVRTWDFELLRTLSGIVTCLSTANAGVMREPQEAHRRPAMRDWTPHAR